MRQRWSSRARSTAAACLLALGCGGAAAQAAPAVDAWQGDLRPIAARDWNRDLAAHLLERTGFGPLPAEIDRAARQPPATVVRRLVHYQSVPDPQPAFVHSGAFDEGLDPFEPSRPAATDKARATGQALGVRVKPDGNRRMQQVADRYLYWLRASRLETQRVGYWWANRMLTTQRPLQEKLVLFWHGHFATSEEKVRDYRKMLQQNELLRARANGPVRDLLVGVARDPAMLAYLDAGVNLKGAPNENFAREIMELFTLGVGHYTEQDIREAARAFTGWNFQGTRFVFNRDQHDGDAKTVLGRTGPWNGEQVIDILLDQPAAAEHLATRLYRYFVRDDVSPELQRELGDLLRAGGYHVAPFLQTLFLSRDFYSQASRGARIKPPVELVVSTYRRMGLQRIPGIPDFNDTTEAMGQKLLFPPNVAGWAGGRSWITPGLLLVRGNFVYDTVFPPIDFVANDRVPASLYQIIPVADRLALGQDVTRATRPEGKEVTSMSNQGDRDEDFNTRLASYHAWRKAIERVQPIPRDPARIDLSGLVRQAGCRTARDAVDHLLLRFLSTPVDTATRDRLTALLQTELGTADLARADTYMEDALRMVLHAMLSLPAYQAG